MAGVRGPSWRRTEILDLLAIWGEEKVQASLRESHRNLDVFEDVAKRMRDRGHEKSAEECRSKTKTMRMAYRRAVAHNSKSGNDRVTCPFFNELEMILSGDASVKSRRASQSLGREILGSRNPVVDEGTLMLFSDNQDDLCNSQGESSQTTDDGSVDFPEEGGIEMEEDSDSTRVSIDSQKDAGRPSSAGQDKETTNEGIRHRDPDDIPPGTPLSELSPSSRLAVKRRRRERMSAIQRVGQDMLRHSSEENREMMLSMDRANERFLDAMAVTRDTFSRGNDAICNVLRDAVAAIGNLPLAFQNAGVSHSYSEPRHEERNLSAGVTRRHGWMPMDTSHPQSCSPLQHSTQVPGRQQQHAASIAGWGEGALGMFRAPLGHAYPTESQTEDGHFNAVPQPMCAPNNYVNMQRSAFDPPITSTQLVGPPAVDRRDPQAGFITGPFPAQFHAQYGPEQFFPTVANVCDPKYPNVSAEQGLSTQARAGAGGDTVTAPLERFDNAHEDLPEVACRNPTSTPPRSRSTRTKRAKKIFSPSI